MPTDVDQMIARYAPAARAELERTHREKFIGAMWRAYLADFFPIPLEPVGEYDDCLDRWVDAPPENICLAISQARRRFGHFKMPKRKRTEICEFIGRVARFGKDTFEIPTYEHDTRAAAMTAAMNQYLAQQLGHK
jgi:hypothetical protein